MVNKMKFKFLYIYIDCQTVLSTLKQHTISTRTLLCAGIMETKINIHNNHHHHHHHHYREFYKH